MGDTVDMTDENVVSPEVFRHQSVFGFAESIGCSEHECWGEVFSEGVDFV